MSIMATTGSTDKISSGKITLLIVLAIESVFFLTVLVAYAALRGQVNWNVEQELNDQRVQVAPDE